MGTTYGSLEARLSVQDSDFSPARQIWNKEPGFDATIDGCNFQLEHYLEKNEHWNQNMNYSWLGKKLLSLQHKHSLSLEDRKKDGAHTAHSHVEPPPADS